MKLNRNDLRKIIYDFSSLSNRLLQADFNDYNNVLAKYIKFLCTTDIIYDYIVDCGVCNQDMETEFKTVRTGRAIFTLGDTVEEEVRTVFAILKYIVENNENVHYGIGMSYSYSKQFQERIKDFNARVVMVLIRHIEAYLTKIGIDMGVDNQIVYNITVKNGQVNIANDQASITASSVVNTIDIHELEELINEVRKKAEIENALTDYEKEALYSSLEVIEQEATTQEPRKSVVKTAITLLKTIKGTVEFTAAVMTLIQFLEPLFA